MNIQEIISETLNNYLSQNLITEKCELNEKKNSSKKSEISAKSEKAERRDGKDISAADQQQIQRIVGNDDVINLAAVARKVYPNHTPEGAQSQLRKKVKQLKNDKGSKYHLKQREAAVIQKIINKL
jgi:hypothetical protein